MSGLAPPEWLMASLLARYAARIRGVISCYDRVVIIGTLPGLCYAAGMTAYLAARGIRIFDYPRWAEPLRDQLRAHAERVASENGLTVEFIRKFKTFRKEDRVQAILAQRGDHPGLVHIFSAMENCQSYQPWHDKRTGRTFLRPDSGKCLHYYFYFIDPDLGLCYLRVPTWAPFRLQFYFNGHQQLAARLRRRGVACTLVDNAFVEMADWEVAQRVADQLSVQDLHQTMDGAVAAYCPVARTLDLAYHWSLMQVEYATDVVFGRREDLQPLYEALVRTAIHAVKPDRVATFLGHKLTTATTADLGTDFTTRIEGTCIKHHFGPAAIKLYDKFGRVLRIETTANDVTFFKHHRQVEQKDGTTAFKLAPVRKTIYSLHPDLRQLLLAANLRYLAFLSELDDPSTGLKALDKVTRSVEDHGRGYKGFNFFAATDQQLFEVLVRGEHTISGVRNQDLRRHFPGKTTSQISHVLKRLPTHGLIKKVRRTYKYYLTDFGRHVALAGLKLKELVLIPMLCSNPT